MELLDRYLQAVKTYLLRNPRRDDIVKELGNNILSEIEDKAEELGRDLNKTEMAAIIKQHGHPLVAAAPYRRLPMQQLIGPSLFPLYWYAVQALVVYVIAFNLVLAVVLALSKGSVVAALVSAWGSFWLWLLAGIGGLTICFGLVEYLGGGKIPFTQTFDPLELPEVKKPGPARTNSVVDLVMGCLFLVGWPIFLRFPLQGLANSSPVKLAPVWYSFEIPMLAVVALGVASALVALFRPQYPRVRAALRLASHVTGVVTFYLFLLTSEFIVASPGAAARLSEPLKIGEHMFTVGQVANYAAGAAPLIALVVFFCDGLMETARLFSGWRRPSVVTHESNRIL
jgi:hypothetical protein